MVAYDSRRTPDRSPSLGQDIIDQLRAALVVQRAAGTAPTAELRAAIRAAGEEASARALAPEALLIQLKTLADEIGVQAPEWGAGLQRDHVRHWMVGACLRAYWHLEGD